MSKPCELRSSERIAGRVLERVIAGSRVEHRYPQSNGEYDIDLYLADGTKAAVEVTSITDEESQRTLANMAAQKNPIEARFCRKSWMLSPRTSARINKAVQKIDQYLSAIEDEGISSFYANDTASAAVSRIANDLAIVEGHVLSMPPPPRIRLGGPFRRQRQYGQRTRLTTCRRGRGE